MKKRETPQALMTLWLQASRTPCRWRLMQARLSNQTTAATGWADLHPRKQVIRISAGRLGAVNE